MTAVTTRRSIRPETLEKIQELVQVNRDSAAGLSHVATLTDNATLAPIFRDLAKEREGFADELAAHLRAHHTEVPKGSTFLARAHRIWIDMRTKLADHSTYALLDEVERGEEEIRTVYVGLIAEVGDSPMQPILTRQLEAVSKAHQRIRSLRDAARLQAKT